MENKKLLELQYDVLGHKPGDLTEIRRFALTGMETHFCTSKAEFVDKLSDSLEEDVYVGINPRKEKSGKATSISNLTCCVIDIDPVRPKGEGSTPEQLKGSIELGQRINTELAKEKATVVSSGSGCHVYFPIEAIPVANSDGLTLSVKKWNDSIKERYAPKSQTLYRIDSIFDLPRIIRVWGSFNSKSKRTCSPIGQVSTERFKWEFSQANEAKKVLVTEDTDELTQRFQRLYSTNKWLREVSDGTASLPSKSEFDCAFIKILCHSGFSNEEIKAVWKFNKGGSPEERPGDIKRVRGKFIEEFDTKSISLKTGVRDYFAGLSSRRMGIRSGFDSLDEMLSGFKEGKIYVFGARPGTGKTTLAVQLLTNMAEQGIPGIMFPTEVGRDPLLDKILSRKYQVSLKKFQNGTFKDEDFRKLKDSELYINSLPLTIYEDFGLTIDDFETQVDKHGPKVVILDYFQALKWEDSNSVGEKENAIRRIKDLTKKRNIVTIVLSQLNRGGSGKASMAELKGTGALEEYADVIGQMYNPEIIGNVYPIPLNLVITKSKYSEAGEIALNFHKTEATIKEDILNQNGGRNA